MISLHRTLAVLGLAAAPLLAAPALAGVYQFAETGFFDGTPATPVEGSIQVRFTGTDLNGDGRISGNNGVGEITAFSMQFTGFGGLVLPPFSGWGVNYLIGDLTIGVSPNTGVYVTDFNTLFVIAGDANGYHCPGSLHGPCGLLATDSVTYVSNLPYVPAPEPMSLSLFGLGLAGLGLVARKRG